MSDLGLSVIFVARTAVVELKGRAILAVLGAVLDRRAHALLAVRR